MRHASVRRGLLAAAPPLVSLVLALPGFAAEPSMAEPLGLAASPARVGAPPRGEVETGAEPSPPAVTPAPTRGRVEGELARAQASLRDAGLQLAAARRGYSDAPLDQAATAIGLARTHLETARRTLALGEEPARALAWIAKGRDQLAHARLLLVPSRGAEARGLLLDADSIPKTPAGLRALLDGLAAGGFNMILPEALHRGYAIYPSRLTDIDPGFAATPGIFALLVREAHARGIEVHPWAWAFRVKSAGFGNPVIGRLPALAARGDKTAEPLFLSPASPQARAYVTALLSEMATLFPLDGVMLDYIRYDEETPEDWISQTNFRLERQAATGRMPPADLNADPATRLAWQQWREHQVDTAVEGIARQLRARRPGLAISAAVFRGESYARQRKMQNWRHWADNKWIDWAAPMLYTGRTDDLTTWLDGETDHHTRASMLYPILGLQRMDTPGMVEQVAALRREHHPGVLFFALAHLAPQTLADLARGPFRQVASPPHRQFLHAARRTLAEANGWLRRIYTRGDWETAATVRMLHAAVTDAAQGIPLSDAPHQDYAGLRARLTEADALADLAPLQPEVRAAFHERLAYAASLIRRDEEKVRAAAYRPPSLPPFLRPLRQDPMPKAAGVQAPRAVAGPAERRPAGAVAGRPPSPLRIPQEVAPPRRRGALMPTLRLPGGPVEASALILDKDGVLLDFHAVWAAIARERVRQALGMVAASQALPPSLATLEATILAELGLDRAGRADPDGPLAQAPRAESRVVLMSALYRLGGVPWATARAIADAAYEAADHACAGLHHPMPRLRETIRRLRAAGWRLAIATTDRTASARAFVAREGLEAEIPVLVGADRVERGKPDPAMFALACAELGLPPDRAVMVGDGELDLQMARAANAAGAIGLACGVSPPALLAPLADAVLPDLEALADLAT